MHGLQSDACTSFPGWNSRQELVSLVDYIYEKPTFPYNLILHGQSLLQNEHLILGPWHRPWNRPWCGAQHASLLVALTVIGTCGAVGTTNVDGSIWLHHAA